jgi:type I restriction enzyme S subunit
MNNITRSGDLALSELKYMDLPPALRDRYLVKAGDVLFNRTNSPELVGKTGMIPEGTRPMAYAGYLVRLRVNSENEPTYLWQFLNTFHAKRVLRGMCKSIIGMANINATEIQSMKLPVPPLEQQRLYAARLRAIARHEAALQRSQSVLNELFASLQQRAFSGSL